MATTFVNRDRASLADFFSILRQRKALIVLVAALVIITTAIATAFLPRWYMAISQVRVEKPEGEVKLFQSQSSGYYDPYFLQDQFKIMQSAKILYPVIEKLGLNEKIARLAGANQPFPTDITYDYLVGQMLRLESPRGSSLIEINVFAREPALAAAVANEIARFYSEDRIAFATSEQREGLAQLRRELESQEKQVSAQRDLVEKLRKDLNISGVDLNARYSDMEIETLRQMQNSLIALSVDAIGRKTRYERFKLIPADDRPNLINSELIQDSNIQSLLQAYLVADQTLSRLKGRLGEAHPELVAAVETRAKIKEQLDGQLRGYESALEIAYKEADARVAELKSQLTQARVDQILSARDRMRPFEEAAQKLEDDTRALTTFKLTLRQREIDFQVPKRSIEILNSAEIPRAAAKPNWSLNLAFAFMFGPLLGFAAAILIEYFDTSFRSVSDVEGKLQRPVLGVIPYSPRPADAIADDPAEQEPFRVLHTNINLAGPAVAPGAQPVKPSSLSLVLLSAGPGEGKSTTLYRLTRVMGLAGERVILIDSDLRRPTQHILAGVRRTPGLADWLQQKASLDEVIQPEIAPGVDFIASGSTSGFTLGLLHAGRLRELVALLKGRYDKVIFDSPPVIGVSDTSVLVTVVDGVVLLVQHRRNPIMMVERAQQIVEGLRGPLLGVVLNQVPANSGEDYGYYTRNYSYYSDKGAARKSASALGGAASAKPVTEEKIAFEEPPPRA